MRVELLTDVADGGGAVHLLVRLHADPVEAGERRPINLALVIDRSSSMRGPRIAQASRAACMLVEQLGERDRLSIITFDAQARVVFGPGTLDAPTRRKLVGSLSAIETGVGTNLAAAIKKGSECIRSGFVRDAVSRMVLLTDGQPSIGITDGERLGVLVEQEKGHGVTTTTMGLGDGFDDEMLAELARRGGGGFYYLAAASDITAAFGRELAGVFAIAATRTELKLIPQKDVISVEVVHRLASRPLDDGLLVEVGELAAGAPRQVLFKLTRAAGASNALCGTISVSYRTPDGAVGDGHLVGIELPKQPISEHAREVTLERLRVAAAVAIDSVWARRASSDIKHALTELEHLRAEVRIARDTGRADHGALEEILRDMYDAEQAVAKSSAEREHARRSMRERSQITLLGQSRVGHLPNDDNE
ncbi:MAG TPA: VWA domain-containing protein [Kofleriaceae bacterium]|nr:VWA domain-containing protein [Kofleriaceae bacterium]